GPPTGSTAAWPPTATRPSRRCWASARKPSKHSAQSAAKRCWRWCPGRWCIRGPAWPWRSPASPGRAAALWTSRWARSGSRGSGAAATPRHRCSGSWAIARRYAARPLPRHWAAWSPSAGRSCKERLQPATVDSDPALVVLLLTMELTETQQAILALIAERIETEGMPPSQAEISRAFGFKGVRAAQYHLAALERAGAGEGGT